jgi:hypothetical protein
MEPLKVHRLILACALLAPALTFAQSRNLPAAQRGGTFHEPPATVDPAYVPEAPNRVRSEGGDAPRLTLRLTLEMPLGRSLPVAGAGAQGSPRGTATAQAEVRWRPVADSHWFMQARFYRYLQGGRQRAWDPDFAYSFGYEAWQPGSFSLVYANYTGTRLRPDRSAGEGRSHFREGVWTAGYKFELPPPLEEVFLRGDGDNALCQANASLVPRFTTAAGAGLGRHKTFVSLGCRYTTAGGWFAQAMAYAYQRGEQQQPWDPDFSYGFGWRADFAPGQWMSAEYANYSGNRWPGRARSPGEGGLRSGSVLLSWATAW